MNKVTLQFRSAQDLWQFKQLIKNQSIEINVKELKAICYCTNREIDMAIQKFGATLVEEKEDKRKHNH
ncbi:MAG: hypothetical protein ACJ75B_11635 [Flavisolibacter sp.]